MALTLVDVGSSPNDGTGDPGRTAFQTINTAITALDERTTGLDSSTSAAAQSIYIDASGNLLAGVTSGAGHMEIEDLNGEINGILVDLNDFGDVTTENAIRVDGEIADFTPTGDATHYGLRVTMDSAATTPTDASSDRHRVYGAQADVTIAGAAYESWGGFFTADISGGDVTQAGGAIGVFGRAKTAHSDATGGGPSLKGGDFLAQASHTAGSITATAIEAEIQQDGSGGTVSAAKAVHAVVDHNAGTLTAAYQFHGESSGTIGTSYGIYSEGAEHHYLETVDTTGDCITALASDAAFAGNLVSLETNISAGTGFNFLVCRSDVDGSSDLEYKLRGDGQVTADGSFTGGGADYAEMFEWVDGNPQGADRVGVSVVFEGAQIRPATTLDRPADIRGVVSASPVVLGDGQGLHWRGKFSRDPFGRRVREAYSVVTWIDETVEIEIEQRPTGRVFLRDATFKGDGGETQTKRVEIEEMADVEIPRINRTRRQYMTDRLPLGVIPPTTAEVLTHDAAGQPFMRDKLAPDYDPTRPYTPRQERVEWDAVGVLGKLHVAKGQPTGAGWVKLRDVNDQVEEWWVAPGAAPAVGGRV